MLTLGVNNKPRLSLETFNLLRTIIYAKCGISFSDAKVYLLESRLMKRLEERNLKSFEDYYYFLTYDPGREKELNHLINCIVTNETSFFRDSVQLDGFRKGVVPKVLEAKAKSTDKTVRIWSSASSTGEEPYTLAIMLMEEGLHLKGYSIEILGTDISDVVLNVAAQATYDRYSLRNTQEQYIKKYFTPYAGAFVLKKEVQNLVKYRKINLTNSQDARTVREMDIVFCRNVLIYFDDAAKKKAVSHLYDSLVRGGYLLVGFSETLHNITRLFTPVNVANTLVYQKL